jgi:uncharacterized protein (DUF2225 family)
MGCPACDTDYGKLEQEIDTGRLQSRDELEQRLGDEDLFIGAATVVYCPGCAQKISRLMDRVSSQLRKQTLAGMHDLLSRNRNENNARG